MYECDGILCFLLQETYMVDMVFYVDEIIQVFNEQFKGSGKPLLYLLHGLNTDSSNFSKPASFEVSTFLPLSFTCSADLVLPFLVLILKMNIFWHVL